MKEIEKENLLVIKLNCYYFSTPTAAGQPKKANKRNRKREVEMLGQIDVTKLGTRKQSTRNTQGI